MTIFTTELTYLKNIFTDQKQKFHVKIDKERKSILTTAGLLNIKKHYSSLEDLETNLKDGSFSIVLDDVHFEAVFQQKKGKYLYVGLSGAHKAGRYSPEFPRWTYAAILQGSYLGIDDPMLYKHDDLFLGWYYGTKSCSYINLCMQLVKSVCKKLDIRYENVIFFGSSGGGYAAIYAATLLKNSLSISINPQLILSRCSKTAVQTFKNKTGIELEDPDPLNRNSLVQHLKENSSSTHVIICNAQDIPHFENHFLPLAQNFGVKIRYGLAHCKNILFWTYDSYGIPNPHNAFETKTIFSIIDYIAKEFKTQHISEEHQELAILINELWRDIYEGKKQIYKEEEKKMEKNLPVNTISQNKKQNQESIQEQNKIPQKTKFYLQDYHNGFVISPHPFTDVAIVSTPDYKQIASQLQKNGLGYLQVTPLFGTTVLIHNKSITHGTILSGYMFYDDTLLHGNVSQQYDFADIQHRTGNFTYFKISDKRIQACHDLFGQGTLFYYQNDKIQLATNRAHLAAIILNIMDSDYKLNTPFITSFVLLSYLFKDQSFNDETPIKNLFYCDLDESIEFDITGMHVKARPNLDITPKKYKEYLQKGIEEIRNNISAIEHFAVDKQVIVDVTGGKDSRLLLAACINNPALCDKMKINTQDLKNSDDFPISLKIASIFDLSYLDQLSCTHSKISIVTGLKICRSYLMGLYNRIPQRFAKATFGLAQNIVHLSGDCGELYRDYLVKSITSDKDITFGEFMDHYFDLTGFKNKLGPQEIENMKKYIKVSLKKFADEPLSSARQSYYEHQRLRKHFGLKLLAFYANHPHYSPIQSKNLYCASRCLDKQDFASARLLYDAVNQMNATLASIEFDKGFDYAEDHKRFSLAVNEENISQKKDEYIECRKQLNTDTFEVSPHEDNTIRWLLTKSIIRIVQKKNELKDIMLILQYIITQLDSPRFRIMASRIFSLEDYLMPLDSQKHIIDWDKDYDYINPIKKVTLQKTATGVSASISVYHTLAVSNYEYGFYLCQDNKIIARQEYSEKVSFTPDTNTLTGHTYKIIAFARHKNSKHIFQYVHQIENN